jgi:hypothetical protein
MVADHFQDLMHLLASSTGTSVSNFAFDKTDKVSILIRNSLKNGFKKTTIEFSELLKDNLRKYLN